MFTLHNVLLLLAFFCFLMDALIPAASARVRVTPLGLAFWVLAVLLAGGVR